MIFKNLNASSIVGFANLTDTQFNVTAIINAI